MFFLFRALSFRISATLLFNVLTHTAFSQEQSVGPMSELAGTSAAVDGVLSTGRSGRNTIGFSTASTSTAEISSSREKTDNLAANCSISLPTAASNSQLQNSRQRLTRRNIKFFSEDERVALFLTDAAQKCVESTRRWGKTQEYPLGVAVCHSVGYVDTIESTVGRQVYVFRLGTVAQLNELIGQEVSKLESDTQLQLSFSTQSSPEGPMNYSRSSLEGALRLSQPAWAPSDDSNHLVNPANPHFTASYGDTEMVLVGSFHLNLVDNTTANSRATSKKNTLELLSQLSPVGVNLVGRDTENLRSHLININNTLMKRSVLVEHKPWGLFKRQNAPTSGDFKPDSSCSNIGQSANAFFLGKSVETPSSEAFIPSSPFSSATVGRGGPSFIPFTLPFNHEQDAVLAASGQAKQTFTSIFQLPGRSLMVFPIGLIIYATLVLMTLMMVILVTFERMKYRNQFRARKKIEKNSPPESTGVL